MATGNVEKRLEHYLKATSLYASIVGGNLVFLKNLLMDIELNGLIRSVKDDNK